MKRLLCIFGFHNYEVLKEEDITMFEKVIGKVVISRCIYCGKIKEYRYYTVRQ